MTDTTTASILSKGTKATGITTELAEKLHDRLGKTIVAIVEISSDSRTEKVDGGQKVNLKIGMLEPAPSDATEDHLRELARSFHYERKLRDGSGQMTIETTDDLEPKVSDVLAAGNRHLPHDYVPDETKTVEECDVCAHVPDHHLHRDPPVDETPDPDTEDDEHGDEPADPGEHDDTADDPFTPRDTSAT